MAKASDNAFPSILVVETAVPANPPSGDQRLYIDPADHKLKRVNSSGTVTVVEAAAAGGFGAYATYVPALTATTTNPTLGSGSTATGRWTQDNKTVHVQINITFGTSGTGAGSGTYRVSLPVTAASGPDVWGHGYILDSSATDIRPVIATRVTTTTFQIVYSAVNGFATNGAPWAWAASDQIQFNLTYEAA